MLKAPLIESILPFYHICSKCKIYWSKSLLYPPPIVPISDVVQIVFVRIIKLICPKFLFSFFLLQNYLSFLLKPPLSSIFGLSDFVQIEFVQNTEFICPKFLFLESFPKLLILFTEAYSILPFDHISDFVTAHWKLTPTKWNNQKTFCRTCITICIADLSHT